MGDNEVYELSSAQLTGCDESHLVAVDGDKLMLPAAARAFVQLQRDASRAGFGLAIASSFRSFERQRIIWNGKAWGERPVHDDGGQLLDAHNMSKTDLLKAILRFSAVPGGSRHHWGTDVDVFDSAAMAPDYQLQLTPEEAAPGGMFDALHCWLDERMAADESHGFFRPYASDTGGVAVERWHLSYAPVAIGCGGQLTAGVMRSCWDKCELALRDELEQYLPQLLRRYWQVGEEWCPAAYRRAH